MTQTTMRAADFTSSVGVEAKLNYTDSAYAGISNVIADLKYIGVDLIRTASVNSAGSLQGQRAYGTAAAAGIKFDFVVNGNKPVADTVSQINNFAIAHPNSVYAIEGPNEVDHTPITFQGVTGPVAAVNYQNALSAQINSYSALATSQIYSFSLGAGATPTGGYTQVALHPYVRGGSQPDATLVQDLKLSPAGAQSVFSETGYSTLPSWASGVDQAVQAKEILNTLFDATKLGVKTTYLYELLDAYADPTGSTSETHYGLFDLNNAPKTSATALHNMMAILADTGAGATTFQTDALNYSVTNMPASGSSLTLEKSNGAYDVVLWNEPQIWNATTHSEVTAATVQETLSLGAIYGDIKVFDPLSGSAPIREVHDASSITIGVQDHPIIIEVSDPMSAPVSGGQPVSPTSPPVTTTPPTSPPTGPVGAELTGTSGADTLTGTSGNDLIHGLGGRDYIHAGAGDDIIDIGAGKSLVDGGDGNDTLSFANATSSIKIKAGIVGYQTINPTTIVSLNSIETIVGTSFNDTFVGNSGDNHFVGGAGDDTFTSKGGHDIIDGSTGSDTVSFVGADHGVSASLLTSGIQELDPSWSVQLSGIENLVGSNQDDILTADNSGSVLNGGSGNDVLVGGEGDDQLIGKGGEDTASYINAAHGVAVSLAITTTQDTGAGHDWLSGIEDLFGSSHDDTLTGDRYTNKIDGGSGNDNIKGGLGGDTLTGGNGADVFVYGSAAESTISAPDTITDFSHAQGDKIDLSALDANTKTSGHDPLTLVDHFSNVAGQLMVLVQNSGYFVEADLDGNGTPDFGIVVHSATKPILSDFVL